MILRNLRTELEDVDRKLEAKDLLIHQLRLQLHTISNERGIEEMTGGKDASSKS
jgi:predicted transcriptional regulator